MYGIGGPEIFIVFVFIFFLYGLMMTIDAVRRPADKYSTGDKSFWVSLLILTNPLIAKFYPGLFYLVAILAFILGSITYHVRIRNGAPPAETTEDSREERMRKRFEAR